MIFTQLDLLIWLGSASFIIEIIFSFFKSSLLRRLGYSLVILLCSFLLPVLLFANLTVISIIIGYIFLFRIFNGFRVVYGRIDKSRLNQVSKRTSLILIFMQLILSCLLVVSIKSNMSLYSLSLILSLGLIIGSFILTISTLRNIKKTGLKASDKYISDMDLPSVSVCIPARNETAQLSSCLESIIGSDYPKLEVLVLDDCSQDKTSEIVKGFARDGVRFIPGKPPAKGWLAKNQAYQALAEASSGEILVFCGVDVRLDRYSLRTLVVSMLIRKKQMISVLPKGIESSANTRLLQPMRYWWEIVLPRRMFNRPPVLSTLWAISRQAFKSKGEMKAVRNSIIPEGYFARELTKKDEYSFIRSNGKLKVNSAKKMPEQWQTSIRTRYPRLRNRPENVAFVTIIELFMLLAPIGVIAISIINGFYLIIALTIIGMSLLLYTHYLVIKSWGVNSVFQALAIFPAAIISEIAATLISMWKYEFSEVIWKDRNICIPVVKNYPSLPKS